MMQTNIDIIKNLKFFNKKSKFGTEETSVF